MDRQQRRPLLKTAATSVVLSLAGCLDSRQDDDGSATESDEDETEPAEDRSDEQDEDSESRDENSNEQMQVGDQPYTRWIPEPEFRSAPDKSVDTMQFTYENGAALRSIEDSLPDDAEILPEDALPLIEQGRTDEILLLETPLLQPDDETDFFTPPSVIVGEFDREQVVESYLGLDRVEWDEPTEYGEFTFLTSAAADEQNELGPVSVGVGESVVLYRTHTGANQGTNGIKKLADAGAGRVERIHEIEPEIARVFEFVSGSTIVGLFYGEQFRANVADTVPEGAVGIGFGYTVREQDTEQIIVYPFTDESSAEAAVADGFPEGDNSARTTSSSVDGKFAILQQTIPTAEFESFPSLGR